MGTKKGQQRKTARRAYEGMPTDRLSMFRTRRLKFKGSESWTQSMRAVFGKDSGWAPRRTYLADRKKRKGY